MAIDDTSLPGPARARSLPRRRLAAIDASIGIGIWLLGAIGLAVRLWIAQRRMVRVKASASPADPALQAVCRELASRLGVAAPSVLRSPFLFSPCLDGIRRPTILLPADCEENLEETFAHELAHLARRDGLWNLLRRSATALFWVQPLLWVLSRRLEATAEEVCDDYVVELGADRARYAGHLLELAGRTLPPAAPAGVGMIALRSMLAGRVVRILDSSRRLSTRLGARTLAAILAAGCAATLLAGMLGVGEGRREALASSVTAGALDDAKGESSKAQTSEPAEVPITGRVIDLEGRPVAGVQVKLEEYHCPKEYNLDSWLEAVKTGSPQWVTARLIDWDRKTPEKARKEAITDRDGWFRLDGIGGERNVELSLRGDTIAYKHIDVVTRRMKPIPAPGFGNQFGPGSGTVYGADFTYTAAPCRPIEGIVKDSKTGEPLEGVEIRSTQFAGSDWIGTMMLRVKSDAFGRFRLLGMPKGKNRLLAVPNDEQPYFLHRVDVPDSPGAGPVRVEVGLSRGIWVEGRLTEEGTGKPVPGARLFYIPFLENTFAQAIPEFGKDPNTDGTEYQDRYLSKADGSFRLVGLPGRALVGTQIVDKEYMTGAGSESIKGMDQHGHFKTYFNPVPPGRHWPTVMKESEPPADARSVRVDLQARSGGTVRFRIVDGEGKPVGGVKPLGRTSRGAYERDSLTSAERAVTNLQPDEERTVAFFDEGRKTGKVIRVRTGDDKNGPVVVTLEPMASISGRVLDADGTPVVGARIRPDLLPGGSFSPRLPDVVTDQDGRFLVPEVPTGCDYALAVETLGEIKNRQFAYKEKVSVQPGKTTDAGDIRFKRD
jgi:beta-lactamase regulating signal transducer with metallopeptidase domain